MSFVWPLGLHVLEPVASSPVRDIITMASTGPSPNGSSIPRLHHLQTQPDAETQSHAADDQAPDRTPPQRHQAA